MSADNSVVVDIKNLREKKKIIDEKYNELVEMFIKYQQMIEDTKQVYDTESAKYFRKIVKEYMEIAKIYLNNDFKLYIDKLDDIIEKYNTLSQDVFNNINGDENEI